MKRYVGLDVSQATTAICVVDGEGRTLAEGVTATEPCAIATFVRRRAPGVERIGMETGPLSVWLWNELRALDLPVVGMDARHANAGLKVMLAKTDRNDAAGIAQRVRTGWFRQVRVKAETSHAVRAELATRTLLVRMRCDLENQIRGLLKTFGLVVGKAPSRLVKRAHEIVADELADKSEFASLVESLLAMRADVVERIAGLDAKLRARARTTPVCRRFMTVPGVGPITALAVWAGIDDASRFARSRDVGAYFGLTPRRYASGEVDRSGRITKRGDETVRTLLHEAANVLLVKISRPSSLRRWGLAIAQRGGFKKAKVAVARKRAVLLHRLWRDGTEFRWSAAPAAMGSARTQLQRLVPAGTTASSERDPWNEGGPRSDLAHHFATLTHVNANLGRPTASIP